MVRQIALIRILIEETRRELFLLGNCKTLTDPDVVRISQQLDKLLNEYEALRRNLYMYDSANGKLADEKLSENMTECIHVLE